MKNNLLFIFAGISLLLQLTACSGNKPQTPNVVVKLDLKSIMPMTTMNTATIEKYFINVTGDGMAPVIKTLAATDSTIVNLTITPGSNRQVKVMALVGYNGDDFVTTAENVYLYSGSGGPFNLETGAQKAITIQLKNSERVAATILPFIAKFVDSAGQAIVGGKISYRRVSDQFVFKDIATTDANGVAYTRFIRFPTATDILIDDVVVASNVDMTANSLTGSHYLVNTNATTTILNGDTLRMSVGLFAQTAAGLGSTSLSSMANSIEERTDPFTGGEISDLSTHLGANSSLSNLTLSTGTLSPSFSGTTTAYSATVSASSITVTPTLAQSTSTVRVNGTTVTSGSASGTISLSVGTNTITVVVTAQNATSKTYTLTITSAMSSDSTLSSLTLSSGTLSPVFSSGTTSYTAIAYDSTITVTPTVTATGTSTVTVNSVAVTSGSASGNISLNSGSNTVIVVVTAQDSSTRTYTLTITYSLLRKSLAGGLLHFCSLLSDGSVRCWGYNNKGQLGIGSTNNMGDSTGEMSTLSGIDLGTGRTATKIEAGNYSTCALMDNSQVKCWGGNSEGQLGQEDTTQRGDNGGELGNSLNAIYFGTGKTVKDLSVGANSACVILNDNSLKCWGYNSTGELGLGDSLHRGDGASEMGDNLPTVNLGSALTVKQIVSGIDHKCAILSNDKVKCWGANNLGQLGLGHTTTKGTGGSDMGDNLSYVDLGTGRTAKSIASHGKYTCAILDNGNLKCWGQNNYGQLGKGNTSTIGDGAGEMGDSLAAIDLGTGRSAVVSYAGYSMNCALLDNNTFKCWGYNGTGGLGQGDTTTRGNDANEMGNYLTAIDLGTGKSAVDAVIGFGENNTVCVKLNDNGVKCWGFNFFGQLGQDNNTDIGDNANEMGDNLLEIDLSI